MEGRAETHEYSCRNTAEVDHPFNRRPSRETSRKARGSFGKRQILSFRKPFIMYGLIHNSLSHAIIGRLSQVRTLLALPIAPTPVSLVVEIIRGQGNEY